MKKTLTLTIITIGVSLASLAMGSTILTDCIAGSDNFQSHIINVGTSSNKVSWSEDGTKWVCDAGTTFNGKQGTRTVMTMAVQLDPTLLSSDSFSSLIQSNNGGWGLGTVTSTGTDGTTTSICGTWGSGQYGSYGTAILPQYLDAGGMLNLVISTGDGGTRISFVNTLTGATAYWTNKELKGGFTSSELLFGADNLDAIKKLYIFDDNRGFDSGTANAIIQAMAIPEPSTATLGLLGLGALMLRRRRQA